MTAEIAVMNKSAVALAADSKVTISGMSSSKAYDTVNKLFTLSKVHPVGIMMFGNAEFMDYPWETIIKLYRKQKGSAFEATIVAWGADFVSFLSNFGKIEKTHLDRNFMNICHSYLLRATSIISNHAEDGNVAVGSAAYVELVLSVLQQETDEIRKFKPWASPDEQKEIIKSQSNELRRAINDFFGSFKNNDINKAARTYLKSAITRLSFSPQSSGFVIAGFGEEEYFPTVLEFSTDGYLGKRIKISQKEPADISREMSSCVRAFAQGDMVQRFMNGIDGELHAFLMMSFIQNLSESCMSVLEKYGDNALKTAAAASEIQQAVNASVKELFANSREYIRDKFSDPVIRMVAMLPKDELAHLAESLVALTSLKRRVSSDAETVGGPVDVALISKGDGFVWVKRKLYFPIKLNPDFASNYMLGTNAGGTNHDE